MKTFELTEKEMKAAMILVISCLAGMGGKRPSDLEDDELTWIDLNDLTVNGGFNRHEAAGLMGSLCEKGFLFDYDNNPIGNTATWIVTTDGWRWLDTVWNKYLDLTTDNTKLEREMFGCTEDEMDAGFEKAYEFPGMDKALLPVSILSDVQELITLGHNEKARQYINRVKYLITKEFGPRRS